MSTQKQLLEYISALTDGELASSEIELAFAALDTADGRAAWNAYHQIGHTLRSDRCGFELSDGFGANLAARMADEAPGRHAAAARRGVRRTAVADNEVAAPDVVTSVP
jgi:sigma-E factor negative regulatory protein RseA